MQIDLLPKFCYPEAEIGKHHPTAIIWVTRNRHGFRYTYCSDDMIAFGRYTTPNGGEFERALALEIYCLQQKGYFTKIEHVDIEG